MNLFNKIREPVVIKSDSTAQEQLRQLVDFREYIAEEDLERLEQDIKSVEAGIAGENAVLSELENSHMPMYILHDIYLKQGELSSQIDYLVITKKLILVIECKNLSGNISIDKHGDFTRIIRKGGINHREGIYSPYTQNQRHLELIREIRRPEKDLLAQAAFDKSFSDYHKSVIVFANSKTVINTRYAPQEIQDLLVKSDDLINYIKTLHKNSNVPDMTDKEMQMLSDFFMSHHTEHPVDYTEKYRKKDKKTDSPEYICPNCGGEVRQGQYGWYCKKKCGMRLEKVYGVPLTNRQIISLLHGKTTTCKTKLGKVTVFPEAEEKHYQGKTLFQWRTESKK